MTQIDFGYNVFSPAPLRLYRSGRHAEKYGSTPERVPDHLIEEAYALLQRAVQETVSKREILEQIAIETSVKK